MYLVKFFPAMMILVRKALFAEKAKGEVKQEEKFLDFFFAGKVIKKFGNIARAHISSEKPQTGSQSAKGLGELWAMWR